MNKYYYVSHFAAAYGEGTYGACNYNEGGTTTSCTTSGGGSSSGAGGGATSGSGSSSGLTNTGVMIAGIITLACVIVFAALVVRMVRRGSRRKLATQEAESRTTDADRE